MEETGTKPIDVWYRFWVNGVVLEHYDGPNLSIEDIMARFSKTGFTPVTQDHIKVCEGSTIVDVYLDHPLYNKLYEH